MKRALSILLSVFLMAGLLLSITTNAAGVDITAAFIDPNFRAEVYRTIGKTAPEPIYDTDVAGVTGLYVHKTQIQSLAGLEYFVGLETLYCFSNQLTSLPALPVGLKTIWCEDNQLTSLPALPPGLEALKCYDNLLTGIDVTGLNGLTYLRCDYNNMQDKSDIIGLRDGIPVFIFYPQANKTQLNAVIAQARAIGRWRYTRSSWNRLQAAIALAQAVVDDPAAERFQVIARIQALQESMDGLRTIRDAIINVIFMILISPLYPLMWLFPMA